MGHLTAAMNEILAANVKTLRESLGLDQTNFADEMDVSQATVSRWERGAEPQAISLTKLAGMAGCSVGEFTTQLLTARPGVGVGEVSNKGWTTLLLPVGLPNEDELTGMFAGLLEPLKNEKNWDVIARRLAQRLPVALAQSVSRFSALQGDRPEPIREAGASAPSRAIPGS